MRHRRIRAQLVGTLAVLLAGAGAPSATADPTPAPLPTKGLGSPANPCPAGMTPTLLTSPAPAQAPRQTPRTTPADPNVTTYPDGHMVRQSCALAAPAPMKGPVIAPPDTPHVSYVLADMTTGEILAAKAAHALLYPASTLKTLTSLVALPKLDPKQVVVATADDVNADGTRASSHNERVCGTFVGADPGLS